MTSHCDVEHVPPNDKASSPGDMTSRRSFPSGGGGSGEDGAPSRGVTRRLLSNLEKVFIFMAKQ